MASKPFVLGGPGGPPDLNGRLRIINGEPSLITLDFLQVLCTAASSLIA